jgi:fatty acid desaturase
MTERKEASADKHLLKDALELPAYVAAFAVLVAGAYFVAASSFGWTVGG